MDYISITISIISVLCVIITLVHNWHKDTAKEATTRTSELESVKESLIRANMKLDQVCSTTNETRADIRSMDTRIQDHDKRLSIVERDLSTAFIRIDELKEEKA